MKALIVSSDERARAWVRGALGPSWDAADAADGHEALRSARDAGPDLVIADQSTEPFGAFGLARELKIFAEPPKVIILLDRTQDSWLAKWSGADRWLTQPVDAFTLAETARDVLG